MAFLRHIASRYNLLLQSHPWKTTTITTGLLCGAGDVIAQQIVEKKDNHDFYRTARLFSMGMFIIAPTLRTWYFVLEKTFGSVGYAAVKKVVCDQVFFAPIFIGSFFIINDILDGKSIIDVKHKLQRNYLSALKMNYIIWPAVQMVNFHFVPLSYRVILVNIVALFWNSYLSWSANKSYQTVGELVAP